MTAQRTKKFVLIDGSSYLFRAFHGLPPLTNDQGEPTGAIYGVINMLRKLIDEEQPDTIAVVFDAKGKNFRHDIFPDYKANRPPMPDDLRVQIEPLLDIIKAMGLPLIIIDNVEADDVIGALSVDAEKLGYDVLISTGDKDMAQLVTEKVTLINTMNNQRLDIAGVKEKFDVMPGQIIDYLALMGDKADNIPGVPKCGPKTAAKWINQYGSLQGVIDHANEVKGKIGEYLRESLHFLPQSYALASIKLDCERPDNIEQLTIKNCDTDTLATAFQRYGFKRWLNELENEGVDLSTTSSPPKKTREYQAVLDKSTLKQWIERIKHCDLMALDTETTSLDYMTAHIVGISLCIDDDACYIPLKHDYLDAPRQLDKDWVLQQLKPLLEDPDIKKAGQNLKYDCHIFNNEGIQLKGIAFDTMLESYVLNSVATRHNMDDLAQYYLNHNTIHFEDIAGKGKKQLAFNQIALAEAVPYAAEDADITMQLHRVLYPKLQKEKRLLNVYHNIEQPLSEVITRIEQNGVRIDSAMLQKQGQEVDTTLQQLSQQAYAVAGETFNLSSPKQIQNILFEKLDIPVIRKTPKGQPSTAEDVLEELAENYELPRIILEHRSLNKLKSTYLDKLPEEINLHTGRIHTSYHQAVASTGRLSSSHPNLQNIPIRSPEGRKIREAFIAEDGYKIMALDYSQIELRIMAHLSQDQSLINAFQQGKDVHRATAAEVFGIDEDAVETNQRRAAKAINFGLIYGMSAFGLAKQLGTGRKEAQEYVDLYFERYPGVKNYMDQTKELAHQQGYVETVLGRRLYLPELKSKNAQRRQYAERTAINAPMQGTAADIIKIAMIRVDDWLNKNTDKAKMIMQVHDELVFEVNNHHLDECQNIFEDKMVQAVKLSVPLVVDTGIGINWDKAH